MSVYTHVSASDLQVFLSFLDVGELVSFEGISNGIENSNYVVDTESGRYVLTLFEHMTVDQVPFYIELNARLDAAGLPTACAVANAAGQQVFALSGRPTILVPRLDGVSPDIPSTEQCKALGHAMAAMHEALKGVQAAPENPKGLDWLSEAVAGLAGGVPPPVALILEDELRQQQSIETENLPQGLIHADLFRDNTLFCGDQLCGLLDFYVACKGMFVYDLAIAANDWCVASDGRLDARRVSALLAGYSDVRPLAPREKEVWPFMLRRAALRFWVSRLQDSLIEPEGEMVLRKDPREFEAIVMGHRLCAAPCNEGG